MGGTRRQDAGQEGGDHRIAVGSRRAEHHERIHVGGAAPERRPAFSVEAQAGSELDDGGEGEEQIEQVLPTAEDIEKAVMEGRDQMRAHLQDEDRKSHRACDCDVAA